MTKRELVEHTRKQVLEVLNSIFSFLKFTTELQEDYDDRYMPTLDFKARLKEDKKVTHQFFEKPTTSKYCVMAQSAMGDQAKIDILTQEVNRRLLNTSEDEDQEVRDGILNTFEEKLATSGYKEDVRRQIMKRGVIRYESLRILDKTGRRRLHRPAYSTREERERKKLTSKEDWYKKKEDKDKDSGKLRQLSGPKGRNNLRKTSRKDGVIKKKEDPSAILFVMRTPGGKLVTLLRKEEESLWPILGHRVKLAERSGVKLKSLLWRADPFGGLDCLDQGCPVCNEEGDRQICRTKNIIYTNTCKLCKSQGRDTKVLYRDGHNCKNK